MTTKELWLELTKHEQQRELIWRRSYVYISHESFQDFKKYFKPQFALFSRTKNYRSAEWLRHVHAVAYKNCVCVHIDHFNPNTSFLLNIPHGFVDVIPYLLWCAVKWERPFALK